MEVKNQCPEIAVRRDDEFGAVVRNVNIGYIVVIGTVHGSIERSRKKVAPGIGLLDDSKCNRVKKDRFGRGIIHAVDGRKDTIFLSLCIVSWDDRASDESRNVSYRSTRDDETMEKLGSIERKLELLLRHSTGYLLPTNILKIHQAFHTLIAN